MTRYNILRTLISSSLFVAAIGCGDPSAEEPSDFADSGAVDPSERGADASLAEEVQLACESACDTMRECPGMHVTIDCVESCVASYATGPSEGDDCALAGIELINCYSALGCSTLPFDDESECADELREVHRVCEPGELRAREVTDSDRGLVIEVGDRSGSEADGGEEEPGPADGIEGGEPEVTDITDPIVIAEIPDRLVIVDFQWVGASEDD